MPANIAKWLTPEEKGIYQAHLDYFSDLNEHPERPQAFTDAIAVSQKFLKSLAACRALMEEAKQYIEDDLSGMPFDDDQVKELEERGKAIYEKLAQAIGKGE